MDYRRYCHQYAKTGRQTINLLVRVELINKNHHKTQIKVLRKNLVRNATNQLHVSA